ncbi:unnamed protein product [Protopolystoma xenopodis]|uniref:Uncharacterized protein n=1 Tax=Protopolystoma xenopodis TaxID=117903 RepID=A0A448WX22_9PLAT|nr:unnamed protein product [Protopolystoma xenopodis]
MEPCSCTICSAACIIHSQPLRLSRKRMRHSSRDESGLGGGIDLCLGSQLTQQYRNNLDEAEDELAIKEDEKGLKEAKGLTDEQDILRPHELDFMRDMNGKTRAELRYFLHLTLDQEEQKRVRYEAALFSDFLLDHLLIARP